MKTKNIFIMGAIAVLAVFLLSGYAGFKQQGLSTQAINFRTNPPKATDSTVFKWESGGFPDAASWSIDTNKPSMKLKLQLSQITTVNLAVHLEAELHSSSLFLTVNEKPFHFGPVHGDHINFTISRNLKAGWNSLEFGINLGRVRFFHATVSASPSPPVPALRVDIPAVPETTGLPRIITAENQQSWDIFAWQTFIAMNWPAIEPKPQNGYLRGFPDLLKNFKDVKHNVPLVWETFKEKREMFKHGAKTMEAAYPGPWSSPYEYGLQNSEPIGMHTKRIFSSAKFTTLDETVEVRAEALEELYRGKPKYDSVSTIARIFRGTTPDVASHPGNAVRYEVKVNYDFYKYVVDNGLYYDPAAFARSKKRPPVQLPWRTSLPEPGVEFLTQKPAETPYVQGYQVAKTIAEYDSLAKMSRTRAKKKHPQRAFPPPRIGAIHLKAAWAPILDADTSRFIWRVAEYFTGKGKDRKTALFGLVGLHIIQRIKVAATQNLLNNEPATGLGGTFIYSTWEHKDIRESPTDKTYGPKQHPTTQYTYTNYFETKPKSGKFVPYPKLKDEPFYVYRLYPILQHTNDVNKLVWDMVGENSVWYNYRLVGTQFKPVNITTDGKITGDGQGKKGRPPLNPPKPDVNKNPNDVGNQPAYLSNLAIETNLGLQQFQGQPPGVIPVPQFSGAVFGPSSVSKYVRKSQHEKFGNVAYGFKAYNQGGCMGCHGVAQLRGYSFSFVLLGGQAGAGLDSELGFEAPFTSRDIKLVEAGQSIYLQSTNNKTFLANSGGRAVRQAQKVTLTIQAADDRVAGSPFRFGDGVTIQDAHGNYLTATDKTALGSDVKQVIFITNKTPAAVWYLYDARHPLSTGDVLRLDRLSFRSAVYMPAFLTIDGEHNQVNTVNHASRGQSSAELWTVVVPPK